MVSGLVVKTSITLLTSNFSLLTLKVTIAPSERPIQLVCESFSGCGQSIVFKPSNNRCAYAVIRIDHCFIFLRSTGCAPRSDTPLTISSLAKTVPNAGHQFTSVSDKKVNR